MGGRTAIMQRLQEETKQRRAVEMLTNQGLTAAEGSWGKKILKKTLERGRTGKKIAPDKKFSPKRVGKTPTSPLSPSQSTVATTAQS